LNNSGWWAVTFRRCVLTCLLLALCAGAAIADERRVALVVGVSNYKHIPPLANPQRDAAKMAETLTRLGFEVEQIIDPDRAALEAGVRNLGQRARGAEAGLFYYAGHALEHAGRNWLLPATADIQRDRDLRFEALDLDSILDQLEGSARVSLLFLDSCRDNPFRMRLAGSTRDMGMRGLGRVTSGYGTFVAFATAPGTVAEDGIGNNSPFTTALLKRIETPGLELRRLLSQVRGDVREATKGRQVPWDNSALDGDFFFRAPVETAAPAKPATAVDRETVFWNSIAISRDPADFQAYLSRFPNGVFAVLARNRLAQLHVAAPPPPASSAPAEPAPRNAPAAAAPASPPAAAAPAAPAPPAPSGAAPATVREALAVSLALVAPGQTPQRVDEVTRSYQSFSAPKAIAAVPGTAKTWRAGALGSSHNAEERVLEGCQFFHGAHCALVAVDDRILPTDPTGAAPTRAMPRVAYARHFDPQHIPATRNDVLQRADVTGYRTAPGPKAAAFHPWGRLFTATAAANHREAAEKALAACNADPNRKGVDGACYVYALGNKVVLPRRLTKPPPPAQSLEDAFSLIANHPNTLQNYLAESNNKAQAVEPDSGRGFRWDKVATKERAEQLALEACQMRYGGPCILLASNDDVKAPEPLDAPRRDMPRVRYDGTYRLDMVPLQWSERGQENLKGYAASKNHKAIAMRPSPLYLFVHTGAASAAEAEQKALAGCNNTVEASYPCFLYAVDDRVVLSQRRTEPQQ
jgi:hypothetical protein